MPKHTIVSDWIIEQIRNHQLLPGNKIYSELELSEMFSVSRNTVRKALAYLESEQIVYRIQGSGTFVSLNSFSNKKNSTKNIGVIVTYSNNYIFPHIINGISSTLAQHGYSLTLYVTLNRKDTELEALKAIMKNSPDGLIIEPVKSALPNIHRELYQQIAERIPCLFINCYYSDLKFPYILPDNHEGVKKITNHLIENGHQKIAGMFKSDEINGHLRYSGYISALQEHGIIPNDNTVTWYTSDNLSFVFKGEAGNYLLENIKTCTAVVCYNDEIAIQLISFLREHGLRIPEDISIVSFDDSVIAQHEFPLTTVAHPKEKLGQLAADSILRMIDNPNLDVTYKFPTEFIERSSVRFIK